MAVISRRPRRTLFAIVTVSFILVACSLVKPVATPEDKQAHAAKLASSGRHAEAAQAYAELAITAPADHDSYELLAAEQWVAAGDVTSAKQSMTAVSADARTKLPISRALVAAEIAVAGNDGSHALKELDSITAPTLPDLAQNYWYLRGEGNFLVGRPVDGTRAFIQRESFIVDPNALRLSREELYAKLRNAAEHGQSLKAPAQADSLLSGWLALGPLAVELQRNPVLAASALENWKRLYPGHPAEDFLLSTAQTQITVATEFPDQIALLLPLSGRAEAVGVAVRDGFIAAYLQQDAAVRPRLKVYDVTTETVAGAYQHAMQDGAGFIVGPLTKEDVAAIAPLSAGRTPVLALNFLSDAVNIGAPKNFYQFALLPEDEARIVARRLVADGKLKGVAILPQGEYGSRIGAAFADELTHLGGTLLDTGRYEAGRPDFAEVIKQTLQVHSAKGESSTHRGDASFVFIAGTPATARLMVSQLKFHFVADVPVYSTSDSYEPDPGANNDLDGLFFPDMPWMVSSDAVTGQIRDAVRAAWPARTARRDRLYAFGFDAYRLVPTLRSKILNQSGDIAGVTGKLHLDDHNRIRRELDWAQIKGGVPAQL